MTRIALEMKKMKAAITICLFVVLASGCASVPLELPQNTARAKGFDAPPDGFSGLYIYRDSALGTALKKDLWVDGECLGETAPNVFFYKEVSGDQEHKISTESEFSPNDLILRAESGKNHFVRQYIKMGAFVGGAGLEVVDEGKGKSAVSKLNLAISGSCSQ